MAFSAENRAKKGTGAIIGRDFNNEFGIGLRANLFHFFFSSFVLAVANGNLTRNERLTGLPVTWSWVLIITLSALVFALHRDVPTGENNETVTKRMRTITSCNFFFGSYRCIVSRRLREQTPLNFSDLEYDRSSRRKARKWKTKTAITAETRHSAVATPGNRVVDPAPRAKWNQRTETILVEFKQLNGLHLPLVGPLEVNGRQPAATPTEG